MDLVTANLAARAGLVKAWYCTDICKGQTCVDTTKDLTGELSLKRGLEPSLVGVGLVRAFSHLGDLHHTGELSTILGVELVVLRRAAQASHIHTVLDRSDRTATLSILHESIVVGNLQDATCVPPLLLSLERDLDHRSI